MNNLIDDLIKLAFAEDIGDGDHTTLSTIPADAMGKSKLLIKQEGILAGVEMAKEVFNAFDPSLEIEVFINDGAHVKPGDVAFIVSGKIHVPSKQKLPTTCTSSPSTICFPALCTLVHDRGMVAH